MQHRERFSENVLFVERSRALCKSGVPLFSSALHFQLCARPPAVYRADTRQAEFQLHTLTSFLHQPKMRGLSPCIAPIHGKPSFNCAP